MTVFHKIVSTSLYFLLMFYIEKSKAKRHLVNEIEKKDFGLQRKKNSFKSTNVPQFPDFLRSSNAPLGIQMSNSSTGLASNETVDLRRWRKVFTLIHYRKVTSLVIVFLGGN